MNTTPPAAKSSIEYRVEDRVERGDVEWRKTGPGSANSFAPKDTSASCVVPPYFPPIIPSCPLSSFLLPPFFRLVHLSVHVHSASTTFSSPRPTMSQRPLKSQTQSQTHATSNPREKEGSTQDQEGDRQEAYVDELSNTHRKLFSTIILVH